MATFTASAALLLRLHMREPNEFLQARAEFEEAAAARAAEAGGGGAATCASRLHEFSFVRLMANSWGRVLLQFLFETSVSVCFWLCTAYLPGFFQKVRGGAPFVAVGLQPGASHSFSLGAC
jgi:hypothetical protein